MTDIWKAKLSTSEEENYNLDITAGPLQFEDNFLPTPDLSSSDSKVTVPLPDSEDYIRLLERKLKKIRSSPKILDALSEKRADVLQHLLGNNSTRSNDDNFQLDAPISTTDSTVKEIYRQIQPVQALSVGETVNIVKYDQLQEQKDEEDEGDTKSENIKQ